jgi:hypothetical protein
MSKLPFNVLANRYNDWDRVPREPITAAITTFLVSAGASTFVASAIAYVAVSAVTSWALSALAPKPQFGSLGSQGILVNTREPAAAHHIVYGEMRKGGTITYLETTGETNEFLHMIVALAGHPVHEIGDIYIDDQIVTIDGSGNVTDAYLDGDGNPTIRIQKFDGTQTSAPTDLLNESELTGADALNGNFVGRDIAYLYIRMKYDQSAYPNGIPLFTSVVKGKRVFDPRSSATVWSDNAALCIRDYLVAAYGLSDSNVDETAFSAAANISDELVTLSGLGTVKRYTINGIVTANTSHGEALGQMVTACAGTLFWGTGKWKLTVADYVAPTKTLTLDDLRSAISVQTRNNLRDQFNVVQGTFIDKDERWITADYPPIVGAGFITEDGGVEQALDLELPFTTSSATAQRLAKLTLFRGREQATISAEFGMNAFDVEVGEIIELNIDRYGWDGKEFEVIGWQLKANQDAGDLRVALTLRETSEAAFDWNAEESDIIGGDTNLPDHNAALDILNLTASGGGRTQGDGTFINSAILNWDNVSNAFFDYYEVEWRPLSDSVFSATTTEQSDIEISPVIDGIEYIFRVRAVTVAGVKGPYGTVQFTGGGDVTAPGLPTNITATGGFQYIAINWTNPADADLNFVEIWESDTNNSAAATRIGISGGSSFQRTNLGLEVTKFYFLKSVDYSGNASAFTASVSATTTFLDDDDFANGIYSLFTEQGLYAIEDVTSLPPSGDFTGQKLFNRTDGKLYTWTGSAWEATVSDIPPIDFTDINGVLTDAQVAVNSIDGTKITDNSITTNQIAARTIQAGDIVTGTLTANEIRANTITGDKVAANTLTASNIQGNTITGDKIVANTITGGLLATSGIITGSAQINDAVITNAKIQNAAVDTLKIAGESVTVARFAGPNSGSGGDSAVNVATLSWVPPTSGQVLLLTGGSYSALASGNENPGGLVSLIFNGTTLDQDSFATVGRVMLGYLINTTQGVTATIQVNLSEGNFTDTQNLQWSGVWLAALERFR